MNLLILGAGVEKSLGMPLANELLPGMINFVYNEKMGKIVDVLLRNSLDLKTENDHFLSIIVEKLDPKITDLKKVIDEIEALQNIKNDVNKQQAKIIKELLDIIIKIKRSKRKKDKKNNKTNDVNQEKIDKLLQDLHRINIDSFNHEPYKLEKTSNNKKSQISNIMKNILKISIKEPNNEILKPIYKNLIDFESLLLQYFVSLYNTKKDKNFKKNFYISWLLWAYLVWNEQEILNNNKFTKKEEKFYSKLTNKIDIITFNYTSFADKVNHGTIYFHGRLDKFIELNTKNEIDVDIHKEIDKVLENKILEYLKSKKKYIIPGIVPPLKLKPVLSSSLLEKWCKSKKMIENASKIVIIGYSFNYADEHFNDLIRKNMNKDIIIVNPDIEGIKTNVSNIFSIQDSEYKEKKYKKHQVYEKGNLKLIDAKAEEIDVNSLFKDKI